MFLRSLKGNVGGGANSNENRRGYNYVRSACSAYKYAPGRLGG